MADQLRALAEAASLVNVDLRIFPVSAGWYPALEGPFLLVEFADRTLVVQIENRRSALFFHEQPDEGWGLSVGHQPGPQIGR
jgi:hypothetical protein